MARTEITGDRILDGTIQRKDIDSTTPGQAVVRKVTAGDGLLSTSSGADAGTGDVVISLASTILGMPSTITVNSTVPENNEYSLTCSNLVLEANITVNGSICI